MNLTFKNLDDLTKTFNTELKAIKYFEKLRWNGERACPHCGSAKSYVLKGHGKYKCADCRKLFSITTGTYFESTKIPLRKWLIAMFLCVNHKKGVSSLQLANTLGVTQKTGWFILHRIRAIVSEQVPEMSLNAVVEIDEAYIGGSETNRHKNKKKINPRYKNLTLGERRKLGVETKAWGDKKTVLGIVERGGKVITKHIASSRAEHIIPEILKHVPNGLKVYTDEHYVYGNARLKKLYDLDHVQHSAKVYVKGDVHTNTIENYWSVVKRCVNGTYHQLSEKHIQAYLNEFSFRYNNRQGTNSYRFNEALKTCHGRLKYHQLIQKAIKAA